MTTTPDEANTQDPEVLEALDGISAAQAHATSVVLQNTLEAFGGSVENSKVQERVESVTYIFDHTVSWTDINGMVMNTNGVRIETRTDVNGDEHVSATAVNYYAAPGMEGQVTMMPSATVGDLPAEVAGVFTR